MGVTVVAVVFTVLFQLVTSDVDYYWKDYTGEIPPEAFPAGKDPSGKALYVGQAILSRDCVAVVQIVPGRKTVYAPCNGIREVAINIKILCTGNPEHLEWVRTTNRKFHLDMTDRHPVLGGYDFNAPGNIYIGRVNFDERTRFGSVASYQLEDAILHFPAEGGERTANSYEVLVYRDLSILTLLKLVR